MKLRAPSAGTASAFSRTLGGKRLKRLPRVRSLSGLSNLAVEFGGSTNACAQETSVILQTHPAAGEKVRDCCDRLFTAARRGTYRQDEITQRKPGARLQNLAISFHIVPVSIRSNSNAISFCEYLIHDPLRSYPILVHFETDR
jgi:hypothetical protein